MSSAKKNIYRFRIIQEKGSIGPYQEREKYSLFIAEEKLRKGEVKCQGQNFIDFKETLKIIALRQFIRTWIQLTLTIKEQMDI